MSLLSDARAVVHGLSESDRAVLTQELVDEQVAAQKEVVERRAADKGNSTKWHGDEEHDVFVDELFG